VRRPALALALLFSVAACARRIPAPIPATDDYLYPAPSVGELTPAQVKELREAWQDILVADVGAAERRLARLRQQAPGRPAVETASGYARLRANQVDMAEAGFARALQSAPAYAAALVGAGSAAQRRGDADAALEYYKRAQAVAPGEAVVRKRLAALKLQVTDRHVAQGQAKAAGGDLPAAVEEYRLALAAAPEVAGVRLALADLLVQTDTAAAVAVLEADPTRDRQVQLRLGSLLLERSEFDRASRLYEDLLARDPADAAARTGHQAARNGLEAAAMPEEYRRIPEADRITRAELAALVMVRVKALRQVPPGQPRVAVDIGGSWAREQIAGALALDVVDVYPNHTFQPGAIVRRVDLARTVARVLDRLGQAPGPAPAPSDMTRAHLDYAAVQRVLGAGLMGLNAAGAFEPWRAVSGREALDVVDATARLVGS
jgi:tetratricopeptide (TPR) repeat protein